MGDDFESSVSRHVERLKTCSCRTIEDQVARKRISWFIQHRRTADHSRPSSPREAYEMVFFDYMGLCENDVPVVSQTETKIVWLSRNPCPTLEACKLLGLDTRQICRAAYEKSTQALVSRLDPELRFHRDYDRIRPYSDHCREMIVRVHFEEMMAAAIREAGQSRQEGNKGYGAVVVLGNRILAQAHDTTVTAKDPSLHAELNAVRRAVHVLGDANLSGAILFSTCEPCPMCSALAVWANLTTIVYGASIEETARLGKSRILLTSREIIDRSPVMIEVISDVLKDQCMALYA
jgi:tRNA(adenine34) deaminase